LDTNWVSSVGPFVDRFERETAAAVGAAHAVAAVTGTAALHVALLTAGVLPGDEVLVPTLTFIATANAVCYCGAVPVFVDVEASTWGLDPAKVDDFLAKECDVRGGVVVNRATGRTVRAVLPVHLYGHPVDLDAFLDVAARWPVALVEDSAESLGARYKSRAVGVAGLAGCLSFNGNKIVTAGGGGMLLTNDAAVAERARSLTTHARADATEWIHREVGYNYRLTNLQAALGVAQLEQLGAFVEAKRRTAPTPRRWRPSKAWSRSSSSRGRARRTGCSRCCSTRAASAPRARSSGRPTRTGSASARCGIRCTASRCSPAVRPTASRSPTT